MRIFQNSGVYPSYRPRLRKMLRGRKNFADAIAVFLNDRFGSPHILQPVYDRSDSVFFTNGDEGKTQRLWASEQGMRNSATLEEILLAQIEQHRTEVFYNLDPMRYGDSFLKRLPGSVKRTVAWRAAPSAGGAFLAHDVIVNNFPQLLEDYRAQGARAEYFAPAHDPEMDAYAASTHRPVDVLFVGTYSRHHRNRAKLLEAIASLRDEMTVVMHLDRSRMTRLAETPVGLVGPLVNHKRPQAVRAVAQPPVFGRELLSSLSSAKIVINCAIDMAGSDRGNMRVWEALGCGAAMVSDAGRYPEGIEDGRDFLSYSTVDEAVAQVRTLISDASRRSEIARNGYQAIASRYSKERQWERFQEIVA